MSRIKNIITFKLIAIILSVFALTGCSSDSDISESQFEAMNNAQKIEMIFEEFSDTARVSRMLCATPHNIQAIKDGKLKPSPKFSERLNEVGHFYIATDCNLPKTLREFDDNFSWFDAVWDFDSLHGWYWFWIALLVVFILSALAGTPVICYIASGFYLICGALSLISFLAADPVEKEPYCSYIVESTTQSDKTKDTETSEGNALSATPDSVSVIPESSAMADSSMVAAITSDHDIQESSTLETASTAEVVSQDNILSEEIAEVSNESASIEPNIGSTPSEENHNSPVSEATSNIHDESQMSLAESVEAVDSISDTVEIATPETAETSALTKFTESASDNFHEYAKAYDDLILRA